MSKLIRKVLIITLGIILIFSLSACDNFYHLYHDNTRKGIQVVGIELIHYNNLSVQDNPLKKYAFDLEKLEILEILCADNIKSFLVELSEIGGLAGRFKQALNSPNGVGIRLNYLDDGFTIITVTVINGVDTIFVGDYDANANMEGKFGISWQEMIDDFKTLINKYFDTQIE